LYNKIAILEISAVKASGQGCWKNIFRNFVGQVLQKSEDIFLKIKTDSWCGKLENF